ncbi:MAG: SiaB family protein kinase [Candidatus Kapabacteria bacterium]|nr:SiaB family protein kinase [Ignavibacteriota bacterium]MCW5884605.1 SiaB family protein kinase [Candidatus Kapabacteria bacterium]
MDLLNIYKLMKENNIIFSFKGAISQEILVEMGNQMRSHLSVNKKFKKIFSVFVELSQNIMHYSDEREVTNDSDIGIGIIIFTEEESYYTVTSGNLVLNSKTPKLTEKLDYIKSLNAEQLKDQYNQRIRQNRSEDSKGAGLGFIEISRKSDNQISYTFDPFDNQHSFFTYKVIIIKE